MDKTWWNKTEFSRRRHNLVVRSQVMAAIRGFFDQAGFIEVDTPVLQVSPGIDRHVKPLETGLSLPFEGGRRRRYLHTSPEFSMKKLLSAGETKIFQISHVFRDEEESAIHHPEFSLLEWYRADEDYTSLMVDLENLVTAASEAVNAKTLGHGDLTCEAGAPWKRMTVAQAFGSFADIDLLSTIDDPMAPSGQPLAGEAQRIGVRCNADDTWDDVFYKVLLEKIEPRLKAMPCVMLMDYPTPVGALARCSASNPNVCERVEGYVCGLELANGFSELTDAAEQRARFERDRELYASLYGPPPPIDEDFLSALAEMPEAAGMALGIDRLIMLLTGAEHIRDVLWAPVDMKAD